MTMPVEVQTWAPVSWTGIFGETAAASMSITVGNSIVVAVAAYYTGSENVSSITDTYGNTYVKLSNNINVDADVELWAAIVTTGGANNVIHVNGGASGATLAAIEITDQDATNTLSGTISTRSVDGANPTSNSFTTVDADAIVLAVYDNSNGGSNAVTVPTGFMDRGTQASGIAARFGFASKSVSAIQTGMTPQWTCAATGHNSLIVLAIKGASGAPPLASGTISAQVASANSIDLTVTAASDGTPPYNYQFQRAPDVTGSPGSFSNVGPNSASLTYTDTPVSGNTTYWYRCVVTDDAAETDNSNNVSISIDTATAFGLTPPTPTGYSGKPITFTVTPNGILAADEDVALSDGAVGGTFSPTSLSFDQDDVAGQTFTWTPPLTYVGTATITATPSPSLGSAPTASANISLPSIVTSPTGLALNLSNQSVSVTGTGTLWLTNAPTFTLTGVSGSSVISQNVVDNTHVTIHVTTGSTAGTGTVTETLQGETASFVIGTTTLAKAAQLGSANAGLEGTIGYTLVNADASEYAARTTSGIAEIGDSGNYITSVTLPNTFNGVIQWDTGGDAPVYLVDEINIIPSSATASLDADEIREAIGLEEANLDDQLGTIDASADTLLTRLSASRAGYFDNLNVGGAVASHADILALNQSASKHLLLATVGQYERPESGTTTYTIECRTFSASTGAAVNADTTPTLTATGNTSGNLSANLSSVSNPATGVYRATYTVSSSDTIEQIRIDVSATISSAAFTLSAYTQVTDFVSATWTSSDASKLTAVYNKLPTNNIADQTILASALATIDDFVDTEVAAILAAANAIKLKTDNLSSDPADASDIASSFSSIASALSAIAAKTGNLPSSPASSTNVTDAVAAILTTALTQSHAAKGAQPTLTQALYMILSYLFERAQVGTTITTNRLDGTTPAMTFETDDAEAPTSQTRAT